MPDSVEAHGPDTPSPLRVGLIGVTGYAYAYVEELTKLVDAGLVKWGAVTIINREAAPEQVAFFEAAGVPIYGDYREMLEAEGHLLDWLCIPTAIDWHTRMTIDALKRGLPVLLEKPLAPTLQDVERIQAAEKASGLLVAIGYQHNYARTTWEIKQRLLDGLIGKIERIDSLCLWPRGRSYYDRNNWSGRLYLDDSWVLDSPLHNAISHVVNLILFLTGPSLEKRADLLQVEAELYRAKPIQSYDTVRTEAILDNGARAAVVLSHSSETHLDPEIRITGSRGVLVWRFSGPHTFEIEGKKMSIPGEDQIAIREQMFNNIVHAIRGDSSRRICSTEQARGEVKWVNAVQDATTIHDIPKAFCRTHEDGGDIFDVVEGLDAFAEKAYAEGSWFSDLNAPWARPPGSLDLAGYTSFQARTIPSVVSHPGPPVN
ncbi:MAG: Gfo/Idh/MocA family oxidoreductase [Oceanipulchritudo sp.]